VELSLILREEHVLRLFENRVLLRIFEMSERERERERGRNGDCRKLNTEDLRNLYYSPHVIRVIKSRRLR
jgi:hypothetical protein